MKVKTPTWSGKAEEAAMYITKFKAMCGCSGFGDAIVPGVTIMSPADYAKATDKKADNVKLFAANRKACAIFILGQESAHGVAMHTHTITSRSYQQCCNPYRFDYLQPTRQRCHQAQHCESDIHAFAYEAISLGSIPSRE